MTALPDDVTQAASMLRFAGRRVKRTRGGRWHVGLAMYTNRQLLRAAARARAETLVRYEDLAEPDPQTLAVCVHD